MTRIAPATPASRLHGLSQAAIRGVVAAAQALELGRADEADHHVIGLLAMYPDHPEVLRLLAGAQSLRGQFPEAIATLQRAIALRPHDALYLNTLGSTRSNTFDYDGAITDLRRAVELDPGLAVAWYNLGLVLMRSMRVEESAAALRRAVALKPDEFSARVILADMLRAEGRSDEALAEYRRVLKQRPETGMAWWGLADMKTLRLGTAEIAQMQRAMQQSSASEADRIATGFALAKAFDDEGRFAESLRTLEQANARARQRQRWNAPAHAASVDAALAAFTPPRAGAVAALGTEAIFIVSLPRSGSTLIEQVLASHSQVDGAGELSDLPLVLTEESRRRGQPFPQWVDAMRAEDWQRLGARYLERTAHWRERRPRFTDKLPYNWFYIGAIRAMLPGARIIVGRRDPLETCFSCYRQHLANNEYTRTFADLAAFWRDFDRAVTYWRALHPTHVFENDYERLVCEPEATIRDLLAFCGLPFEPACLDFHKTERDVHTPSAMQVREPLRRDTARAARYGALLDPLRAELGLPPFAASTQKD